MLPISELYAEWDKKQKEKMEKLAKKNAKAKVAVVEEFIGLTDEQIDQLPPEWQEKARIAKDSMKTAA